MELEAVTNPEEIYSILALASFLKIPADDSTQIYYDHTESVTLTFHILKPLDYAKYSPISNVLPYKKIDLETIEMKQIYGAGNIVAMGYGSKSNKLIVRKHNHDLPSAYEERPVTNPKIVFVL